MIDSAFFTRTAALAVLAAMLWHTPAQAQQRTPQLPFSKVFIGEKQFHDLVRKAQREQWRNLALGDRTVAVGLALVGTPYANWTLEVDDRIEAVSANFDGMDCWTFFEIALGFARMLAVKDGGYTPQDLLAMIELERYRGGKCTGNYFSRLHHLEDWMYDNERRGLIQDLNRSLGGVRITGRNMEYMGKNWKQFRYLRADRSMIPKFQNLEREISSRAIYHIPKATVPRIEPKLQNGDVISITTHWHGTFTSHVGLAYRDRKGTLRFMHASRDERKVIVDSRLSDYLNRFSKHAGIMVARPMEVTRSARR